MENQVMFFSCSLKLFAHFAEGRTDKSTFMSKFSQSALRPDLSVGWPQ